MLRNACGNLPTRCRSRRPSAPISKRWFARKTPQRVAARAAIVLATGDGKPMNAIARSFASVGPTVYLWRRRFEEAGIVGLVKDAPRPGTARR